MDRGSEELRSTPGAGPGGGNRELRAQGLRTRTLIVRAATKLLLQGGGLDFTLRAVARQAKVSVSNLQYYFPDRQALLRSVMAPIIDDYLSELNRALNGRTAPREALAELFARQMRDVKDAKSRALWSHFAALSTVDPECSRLFGEWYDALVRGIAQLIAEINPKIDPNGALQLAALLIAMGDGLGYLMGRNHGFARDLDEHFLAMVDFLLQGPAAVRPKLKGAKS